MVLKRNEWIGRRFGRLTVTDVERSVGYGSVIVCRCDCGNETRVKNHNLVRGSTQSCGCLWKQKITTHGKSRSRGYILWKAMRTRCSERANDRHNYIDRGITVCDRWANSFENFLDDMGEPPDGLTLERIDNDKGYGPDNCKWATYSEQLNNTRAVTRITAFGETRTITQWATLLGIDRYTLYQRLIRRKMPPEKALAGYLLKRGPKPDA